MKCKVKGENNATVNPDDNTNTVIYPYIDNLPLRTTREYKETGIEASNTGCAQHGIKSLSPLVLLMPDVVSGVSIDIMHCVFLGVVKKLSRLWFDSSERYNQYSLHDYLDLLDSRLKEIKPPSYIPRVPRSIAEHYKHWKASEWKLWFFYYSVPLLKGVMEDIYF